MVREPKLFLFDEPLSNLDAALRVAHAARDRASCTDRLEGDDDLRHPRPGRGDDAGRQDRRAERRQRSSRSARRWSSTIRRRTEFVAGFIGSPKMNFVDGATAWRQPPGPSACRPEHMSVERQSGRLEGHGRPRRASRRRTPTSISTAEKAGLITDASSASDAEQAPRSHRRRTRPRPIGFGRGWDADT